MVAERKPPRQTDQAGIPQNDAPFREIVGVVGDVPQSGLDAEIGTEVFLPMTQHPDTAMTLLVRTSRSPMSMAKPVIGAIHALDKDQAVTAVQPMNQYIAESLARRRFHTLLLGVFGALALVLASVGIYGVVSYGVAQRTREIGIRTALGANRGDVLRLVFRQSLQLAAIGLVIGAVAAVGLTRFLEPPLRGRPDGSPHVRRRRFRRDGRRRTGLRAARAPGHGRRSRNGSSIGVNES